MYKAESDLGMRIGLRPGIGRISCPSSASGCSHRIEVSVTLGTSSVIRPFHVPTRSHLCIAFQNTQTHRAI